MNSKIITTLFITIVFIAIISFSLMGSLMDTGDSMATGISLFIGVGSIGCFIMVMIQRIREIRKGEEDDLDNY